MIDVNIYLSRWPFRRLVGDEPEALVAKLRSAGVTQAWCGSFDAILHRDTAAVNSRLVSECRRHAADLLEPFGTVNPTQPDWEEDVRRCHETHKMRGLRLHPNYHGYMLDDPLFAALLAAAAKRGLVVQIVATMEDERTQHPMVRVPIVDLTPLPDLLTKVPEARVVLLNAFVKAKVPVIDKLAATGRAWFDISTRESVAGVEKLVQQIGHERILFGSCFPYYYFESAEWKLRESPLGGGQVEAIKFGNAKAILAPGS